MTDTTDTTKAAADAAADALDGIEPAGWIYMPSDTWRDYVMTQDADMANLARTAGRNVEPLYDRAAIERARADERERCAAMADEYATWGGSNFRAWFLKLAAAIRARGTTMINAQTKHQGINDVGALYTHPLGTTGERHD
jgi:hypothetical protein